MKKSSLIAAVAIAAAFVMPVSTAFATGVGDVEIRLNNCANMAFIGLPNTVEIWIMNDALLDSMKMGFEYTIGRNYLFNPAWGNYGYVNEEGDAVGAWSPLGLTSDPYIDNISPDQIHISGGSFIGSGLPLHATHSKCYTMQVAILAGQLPLADGFCVDNVFISPNGVWNFIDFGADYAPDFQGNPNSGTSNPDAPPVCFDIVDPCWADGDVNNDGVTLSVTDFVLLGKYVQDCSYVPPVLHKCDLYGDGVIDQLDVDVYADYFQQGMGAFICGYPAPTRCDPCGYPRVTGHSPGQNAIGVSKAASIFVFYDSDIVTTSIENTNIFEVRGHQSGKKSGSFTFSGPPINQVTFDPATDFFGGEQVCVTIHPGVESVCGAVSPCAFKWCFTTTAKKGNGSFPPGVMNNAGGNVSSTVAADFDLDGDLDLATVFEDSDSMSCMFNNGSGQLSLTRGVYPVGFKGGASSKLAGIVARDYDNDDDIDVVVIRGGDEIDSSSFVFMENDGTGAFTSTAYQLIGVDGLSHSTPSMITGDFNRDGHSDLVMAIGDYAVDSAALMYFENNGEGVFSSATRGVYPVGFKGGASSKPAGLAAGDYDNDGGLDVCMFLDNYDVDSAALICLSGFEHAPGDSIAVNAIQFDGPSNGVPTCVSANIDGDSDMDVVVTMNSPYIDTAYTMTFFNDGGTFYATGVYPVGFQGGASGKPASAVADVDADDDLDIVSHYGTDSIWVFANDGDGQFELKRGVYPVGFQGGASGKPAGLAAGDFDGNGSIDIAVSLADTFYVAIMFGEGDYTPGDTDGSGTVDIDDVVYLIQYIFAGGPAPNPIESADVDCSGSVDIDDVVYLIQYIFAGGPAPGDPNGDTVPDC